MTSESESFKTNEFLRRRKLRLQQVREQSKEIAKKIRQRAKVEKLKEVGELDAKRQKEYFHHQEQFVKQLEQLYAAGVRSVGAGHQQASQVTLQDIPEKLDVSKKRGKEAAAELRRRKQEKLDEQKKLLQRKLQAREAANEISREKSSVVASKLNKTSSKTGLEATDNDNTQQKPDNQTENLVSKEEISDKLESRNKEGGSNKADLVDMATQWNFELPDEWEPHIPELLNPRDDKSTKEGAEESGEVKQDKNKPNLFAVSDEMPSSLRGGLTDDSTNKSVPKPTLTLVSEYLLNRDMHLREYDKSKITAKKKHDDDLQSIKNTILRARASNTEGISIQNVCHVADVQVVPVPSWHAENRLGYCPQHSERHRHTVPSKQFKTVTNYEINNIFSSIRPKQHDMPNPSPVLRGISPFKRSKFDQKSCSFAGKGGSLKSSKSNDTDVPLVKKKSVTMYDHSTRDTKDIPCGDQKLVVRDSQGEEDAYSQAARESASGTNVDKHQKKLQDMRNKIAVTKQSVEKEYRDTMAFLQSMPKDKSRPIKYAYMDEERQESHKELRQKKMQDEFKKIEKECKKQSLMNANQTPPKPKRKSKSKSPKKIDSDDDFDSKDFQYSWMPVPETDNNLAIHTIPTNVEEGKSRNGVQFSKVDSYHEYRSRHKHTPPTKDTNMPKKHVDIRAMEAVVVEQNADNSGNSSTAESEVDSNETITPPEDRNNSNGDASKLSDAERIIIYKILDAKVSKNDKEKKTKMMAKIAKSLTSTEKSYVTDDPGPSSCKKGEHKKPRPRTSKSPVLEQINEGIYKRVDERGDNVASLYFTEGQREGGGALDDGDPGCPCCCGNEQQDAAQQEQATGAKVHKVHWETGDKATKESLRRIYCGCKKRSSGGISTKPSGGICKKPSMPSATTSTSSFRSALNATTEPDENCQLDGGYIKLLDEDGQEAGKFYIGASGFMKNDAYEVVIQLKKKADKSEPVNADVTSVTPGKEQNKNDSEQAKILEGTHNAQRSGMGHIPEENAKQKDQQNKPPNDTDANKKGKEYVDTAITTEGSQEIRIVSYEVQDGSYEAANANKGAATSVERTVPKQATTCTQTSFENHDERHRPVRMSSTSTAYMSPPELILPTFLKQDYKIPFPDLYDFTVNSTIKGVEVVDHESFCCGDFTYCRCKRCTYERTNSRYKEPKMKTPPNTARTGASEQDTEAVRVTREEKAARHNKHKRTCRKRSSTKVPLIFFAKNNKSAPFAKNPMIRVSSKASTFSRSKKKPSKDSNMSPVIKSYIDKLLDLNQKGMKAIEVVNQECSSVTTPGSSIIEMPLNKDRKAAAVKPKISLTEHIKELLIQDIINENETQRNQSHMTSKDSRRKSSSLGLKRRSKCKSLYVKKIISKPLSHIADTSVKDIKKPIIEPPVSSTKLLGRKSMMKLPVKSSSSSNSSKGDEYVSCEKGSLRPKNTNNLNSNEDVSSEFPASMGSPQSPDDNSNGNFEPTSKRTASETESNGLLINLQLPPSTSTQTNLAENNLMKLAEDKLHNMEKIAELTEKCTKRLSNLAKVLDQVRKNKTLAYSQVSDSASASDSEKMTDKMVKKPVVSCDRLLESQIRSNDAKMDDNPEKLIQNEVSNVGNKDDNATLEKSDGSRFVIYDSKGSLPANIPNPSPNFPTVMTDRPSNYEPLLSSIPKPSHIIPTDMTDRTTDDACTSLNSYSVKAMHDDAYNMKIRAKPPPALSRLSVRQSHDLEHIVPHELSTVAEVDSPMSAKLKSQSARNEANEPESKENRESLDGKSSVTTQQNLNPDLLHSNVKLTKQAKTSNDSSDESKMQMMDLKKFNEIMLKPFISIQDYVKQCNVPASVEDGSTIDQNPKDSPISDEISSLHSDGSLPDVIAELLKRNVIKEPFKFDTVSNVNSTTISSESSFSVLALSKVKHEKKKFHAMKADNKENIAETSDTMSISSNPDLEHAFKQLGMGWASSTLKKTKERLALSSSSNTSSSSTGMHFKMKANNIDVPYVVSDSVSSLLDISKKDVKGRKEGKDPAKNAEQQTSQMDAMTVKDFLTNQLAKKITFTNKSHRDGTEEFISLCETRIPEEERQSSQVVHELSGARARTSTPVQLFKSMAYRSSSSSNVSNGLFSNADELSSVKGTSNSVRNHSTSDKDDLTIPNYNLKLRKGLSDTSKSD